MLTNIEFYNTPEGYVMIKEINQAVKYLHEQESDLIVRIVEFSLWNLATLLRVVWSNQ